MASFGVVFDLDGLLVDSERVQAMAFNAVLAPYGITLSDEEFAGFVGYSTLQNFRDLAMKHPGLAPDVLKEAHDLGGRLADAIKNKQRFPEQEEEREQHFEIMRWLVTEHKDKWPYEHEYWQTHWTKS